MTSSGRIGLLLLAGCVRNDGPPKADRPAAPTPPRCAGANTAQPEDIWAVIAYYGAWLGGAAFAAGILIIIASFFGFGRGRQIGLQLLLAGIAISASAQLMLWIGAQIKWIALVVLLLGLLAMLVLAWFRRKQLIGIAEDLAGQNFDDDPRIGNRDAAP